MSKKPTTWIILSLICLALVLGALLFPRYTLLSNMYYQDKHYYDALRDYEILLSQGKATISTKYSLIRLYEYFGRIDDAIALAKQLPSSPEVKELLIRLYNDAGKPREAADELESLYKQKKNEATLREILTYYKLHANQDEYLFYLNELAQNYKPEEEDYYNLLYLLATSGKKEQALDWIDKFSPEKQDPATIELEVRLLLDAHRIEQALGLAISFVQTSPEISYDTPLLYEFLQGRHPEEALKIASAIPSEYKQCPAYYEAIIAILDEMGNKDRAYTILKQGFQQNTLGSSLLPTLLERALERNDRKTLKMILKNGELKQVSSYTLALLAQRIALNQDQEMADVLAKTCEKMGIKKSPGLAYAIQLARQEEKALEEIENAKNLEVQDRVLLASILLQMNESSLARRLLAHIESLQSLPPPFLKMAASVYAGLGEGKRGLQLIQKDKSAETKAKQEARLLLLAATGEEDKVITSLKELEDPAFLEELFDVAVRSKQAKLALYIAKKLSDANPSLQHESMLAEALALNGQIEESLHRFQTILPQYKAAARPYLDALLTVKNSRQAQKLIQELTDQVVREKQLSEQDLRQFGYSLLDAGDRFLAKKVFSLLAENKEENSQDVATLLYLTAESMSLADSLNFLGKLSFRQLQNNDLLSLYLGRAVEKQDFDLVKTLLESRPLPQLGNNELFQLISSLIKANHRDLIELLKKQVLLTSYREDVFSLALTADKKERADKANEIQSAHPQDAALLPLFAALDEKEAGMKLLRRLATRTQLPERELLTMASLYVKWGYPEEGIQALGHRELPHILLATALGKEDLVQSFVDTHPHLSLSYLLDLYYTALDFHHTSLALSLATILYERSTTQANGILLAEAYVLNKQYKNALTLYQEIFKKGGKRTLSYMLALIATQSPALQEELDLVPYDLNDQEKKELIFLLIDGGYRQDATALLLPFVQGKSFDDPDMQTLFSLFGEELSPFAIAFIAEHGEAKKGLEKKKWLELLLWKKQAQVAETLFSDEDLQDPILQDLYIDVLGDLKRKENLTSFLCCLIEKEEDIARLKHLGKAAKTWQLLPLSLYAYEKAYELNPCDSDTVRQTARAWYDLGAYQAAKKLYCKLFCLTEEVDYLSYAHFGEILYADKGYDEAKEYFEQAYCLVDQKDPPTQEESEWKAKLLAHLEFYETADTVFIKLIENDAQNSSLLAGYVGSLLLQERYDEAAIYLENCIELKEENIPLALEANHLLKILNCREKSLRLIENWLEHYPKNTSLLNARAEWLYQEGFWQQALSDMRLACCLEPLSESLTKTLYEYTAPFSTFYTLGPAYRKQVNSEQEFFQRIAFNQNITETSRVEFFAERSQFLAYNITVPSTGEVIDTSGARERGELALVSFLEDGTKLRGSLFAADDLVGGSAEVTKIIPRGLMRVQLAYHVPNWDFIQGVVYDGAYSQYRLSADYRFSPLITGSFGFAQRAYSIQSTSLAATTFLLDLTLSYECTAKSAIGRTMGPDSFTSIIYNVHGEYVLSLEERINRQGEKYDPFYVTTQELHTLTLFTNKQLAEWLSVDAFGGFQVDRYGGRGPTYGAAIHLGKKHGFQCNITANHSLNTHGAQGPEEDASLELKYIF